MLMSTGVQTTSAHRPPAMPHSDDFAGHHHRAAAHPLEAGHGQRELCPPATAITGAVGFGRPDGLYCQAAHLLSYRLSAPGVGSGRRWGYELRGMARPAEALGRTFE